MSLIVNLIVTIGLVILVAGSFMLSGMAFEDESDRVSLLMALCGLMMLAIFGWHVSVWL